MFQVLKKPNKLSPDSSFIGNQIPKIFKKDKYKIFSSN